MRYVIKIISTTSIHKSGDRNKWYNRGTEVHRCARVALNHSYLASTSGFSEL